MRGLKNPPLCKVSLLYSEPLSLSKSLRVKIFQVNPYWQILENSSRTFPEISIFWDVTQTDFWKTYPAIFWKNLFIWRNFPKIGMYDARNSKIDDWMSFSSIGPAIFSHFFMWFNSNLMVCGFYFQTVSWRHFHHSQRINSATVTLTNVLIHNRNSFILKSVALTWLCHYWVLWQKKSWYSWTFTKIKTVNEANRVNSILISA